MDRRTFLSAATATVVSQMIASPATSAETNAASLKPMALGLLVSPFGAPEATIRRVHDLGFSNCFLSLDGYVGGFTPAIATQMKDLLNKYEVVATTVEVVGPPPLEWNFLRGPATIGLVPPATRAARIDALRQASDFAKLIGVNQVQTHCGFIPEDPNDPLYDETIPAIREAAGHCRENGQTFLYHAGAETAVTLLRTIRDVGLDNQGVGLDTANGIMYGTGHPVDALEIYGQYLRAVNAKDALWPTDPIELGKEVPIGAGKVDFPRLIRKLRALNYTGPIIIEREISGPQQIEDIKKSKADLERWLRSPDR